MEDTEVKKETGWATGRWSKILGPFLDLGLSFLRRVVLIFPVSLQFYLMSPAGGADFRGFLKEEHFIRWPMWDRCVPGPVIGTGLKEARVP